MIFVQFILFKKINVNLNTCVIVMFLKHVIIHCCVLFDQTGNTVDEPVQWQHFTLTFLYMKNIVRQVLFAGLLGPPKFNLTSGFFIFLFMMTGRGIIFICSTERILNQGEGFVILSFYCYYQKQQIILISSCRCAPKKGRT